METQDLFRIAFICTGNRCRSPYAAKKTEAMTEGLRVEVSSAGTLNAPGHPSPPELIGAAERRRVGLHSHKAVPISAGMLAELDLVIGFSFNHVATAVVDGGAQRSKTFTLPELARLLDRVEEPGGTSDPVARAREVVRRAHALRAGEPPSREEVRDPFGGPASYYEEMVDEIDGLLERVVDRLFGGSRRPA